MLSNARPPSANPPFTSCAPLLEMGGSNLL